MGLLGSLGKVAGVAAAPFTGGASLAPMLIGAGVGAAKHFAIDKPAEKRSREMNAEIMRYSPWSGIQAPGVKTAPGLFSSTLQGGALGAMAGQAMKPGAISAWGKPSVGSIGGQVGQKFGNGAFLPGQELNQFLPNK